MRFVTRALGFVALAVLLVSHGVRLDAITNGTTVSSTDLQPGGQYGWLVRLESENGLEHCSGSVVGQEWVLSAYHCSTEGNPNGVGVTRAFIGGSATPIAIAESFRVGTDDAALFHLAAPVGPAITPARIAPSYLQLQEGASVLIAGWGQTDPNAPLPSAPAVGQASVAALNDQFLGLAPDPSTACGGDSGGPAFLRDTTGVVIYGVISSSDANCASDTGAVSNADFASVAIETIQQDLSAPVALSGDLRTAINTPVEVPIDFSDPGGFPMSFRNIVDFDIEHGRLDGCTGDVPPLTCTFVPDQDFVGIATFRYTVTDGLNAATAIWTIEVYDVPTVTITKTRVKEPTGNKPQLVLLEVQLAGPVARPVTVDIAPNGGSATSGVDYRATPMRIVLSEKNRTGTYRLMLLPDTLSEFNETITFAVTATDGVKVVVPNPAVTIVGDKSLPPVVDFVEGFVGSYEGMSYVVAEVSDPDGAPLAQDNYLVTWFPSASYDTTKVSVAGFGLLEESGHTYVAVVYTPVDGSGGTTPLTLTIADETGASGSDTINVPF